MAAAALGDCTVPSADPRVLGSQLLAKNPKFFVDIALWRCHRAVYQRCCKLRSKVSEAMELSRL